MKNLSALIFLLVLIVCSLTCTTKKNETNGYEILTYSVSTKDQIGRVKGVINYHNHVLILGSKDKIFGLNTETNSLKEYRCNLKNIHDFLMISDSLLVESGSDLFYMKTMTEGEIIFEKYEYVDEDHDMDGFYPVYNINEFSISSCCNGEWGGSAFFKNNKSGLTYSTRSTCLINVDTFNHEIYLFNFMWHMLGFTSVAKIGDVESLPIIEKTETCNWYNFYENKNQERRDSMASILLGNTKKNKILFDTIAMPIVHGFVTDTGVKLVHKSKNTLSLLSVSDDGNIVPPELELVKFLEDQSLVITVGRSEKYTTLSCNENSDLRYIVNIDKDQDLIRLYEIDNTSD